ncbi:uncharacterized protein LOC113278177 isoform X3 [Papaver somniferum]|uniref:uncharacterized protein LOC113278177 isoform X3 n=1 Tax=Papaver somniferum TaxID=3469 RepID=UPI000E6FF1B9|nr:uncharacterized protein LOC113278177 isoform X3 [Papaver somniferum]
MSELCILRFFLGGNERTKDHREVCKKKAELERQLEEERAARRGLGQELNELVSTHEEELVDSQTENNEKLNNLHVEYKVLMTKACKAAALRERQRATAATAANIVVPPPIVESELVQIVTDVEDEGDDDQRAPDGEQT